MPYIILLRKTIEFPAKSRATLKILFIYLPKQWQIYVNRLSHLVKC